MVSSSEYWPWCNFFWKEQVLRSIDIGSLLEIKFEPYLSTITSFIKNAQIRIKDGTFTPHKYIVQSRYYLSILSCYLFNIKIPQINPQAFWRLVNQSQIKNYPKVKKDQEMLTYFYRQLFDFRKPGFCSRESFSTGEKTFHVSP